MTEREPSRSESASSAIARVGEASGLGWFAAMVSALPTALRAHSGGGSFRDGWLIGAAVAALFLVPLAWLVPHAARGFRGVVGKGSERRWVSGLVLWSSLAVLGVTLLATLLAKTTHHRGLGGATFGIVGAGALLCAAIAAGRIASVAEGQSTRVHGLVVLAAVFCAAVALTWPLVTFAGGGPLRATSADLLFAGAVSSLVVMGRVPVSLERMNRVVAPVLVAVTLIVGYARVEQAPETRAALHRAGGFSALVLGVFERWTDADGDGAGAHFGGADCDEGDPARHPKAAERAGDGIDSDCDGHDGDPTREPDASASASASASAFASAFASASASPSASPSAPAFAAPSASASASAVLASEHAADPSSGIASARLDIVLVTLDTVRADRTSIYGYDKPTTPRLAAFAKGGVVFEHAYAVATDTQRALIPVVSGMPLAMTPRTADEWPTIDDRTETVAERMTKLGYATTAVTSFTWLRQDRGFGQGFGTLDESPFRDGHPERTATSARVVDAALTHYARLSQQKAPIFLWLHLFDAHARYLEHDGIRFGASDAQRYLGELNYIDRELGRLIDAVTASPRAARTAWLVHGTHGEAFGEHGSEGHGAQLFDEVLRVPLFVVAPTVRPARWDAGAVSTLDIAPTLLALAGGTHPDLPGVSLRPALDTPSTFRRAPVVAHAYRRVAVIDWPLKLLSFRTKAGKERLSLFDLATDPAETKDLSGSRAEDLRRLAEMVPRDTSGASE